MTQKDLAITNREIMESNNGRKEKFSEKQEKVENWTNEEEKEKCHLTRVLYYFHLFPSTNIRTKTAIQYHHNSHRVGTELQGSRNTLND